MQVLELNTDSAASVAGRTLARQPFAQTPGRRRLLLARVPGRAPLSIKGVIIALDALLSSACGENAGSETQADSSNADVAYSTIQGRFVDGGADQAARLSRER